MTRQKSTIARTALNAKFLCVHLFVVLSSASNEVSWNSIIPEINSDPGSTWAWVHSDGVGLREKVEVREVDSADAGEQGNALLVHAGLGSVAMSEAQQFAVVCDANGSFKIYRVQMYPNLYPEWGYLLYGRGRAAEGPFNTVECSMSEDGATVLWKGTRNGHAHVRLFVRVKTTSLKRSPDCPREDLDPNTFEIIFPQDPYDDAWVQSSAASDLGFESASSVALSRDGTWLAFVKGLQLSIASLKCKDAPPAQVFSLPVDTTSSQTIDGEPQHAQTPDPLIVFGADSSSLWSFPRASRTPLQQNASASVPVARRSSSGAWTLGSALLPPREAAALSDICSVQFVQARAICDAEAPFASGLAGLCDAQLALARELLVARSCSGDAQLLITSRAVPVRLLQTLLLPHSTAARAIGVAASGRVLAVSTSPGAGAQRSGAQRSGASAGSGAGGSESVEVFAWDLEAGAFGRVGGVAVRGRVEALAVCSLRRHYLLALVASSSSSAAAAAGGGAGRRRARREVQSGLLTASSASEHAPRHHPRARQQDFYLPAPCVFPVDRACSQRPADYEQEWGGLLAANSASVLLVVVVATWGARAAWRAAPSQRWSSEALLGWVWLRCGGGRGGPRQGEERAGRRCGRVALDVVSGALLCFSAFEVLCEPAFVNDWPAHLHHVRQYREGRLDVQRYMHFHGNNPYAAMFIHVYTALHALTSGSLPPFQLLWAVVEVLSMRALGTVALDLGLDPVVALLPLLSNRLHLYQVRVVTNDGLNAAMMLSAVRLAAAGEWVTGSVLYGLVLGSKLNFITFLPAWLWACFHAREAHWTRGAGARVEWAWGRGVPRAAGAAAILGLTQAAIGAPFLLGNAEAYVRTCFDLSRNLLWDKTRVFKWVGRLVYGDRRFHLLLLAITAVVLAWVFLPMAFPGASTSAARRRLLLFGLLASNQVVVGFAKALYTPFLAWSFYALPIVLGIAECPVHLLLLCWALHEVLFRPFGDAASDSWGSLALFLCQCLLVCPCLLRFNAEARPSSARTKRE